MPVPPALSDDAADAVHDRRARPARRRADRAPSGVPLLGGAPVSAAAAAASPVLEATSLTRNFSLHTGSGLGRGTLLRAVRAVDIDLRPGTVTALVGESGSGKSTVARLLALLDRPTSGAIRYGDVDAARLRGR